MSNARIITAEIGALDLGQSYNETLLTRMGADLGAEDVATDRLLRLDIFDG
jgi:hypothetical protein